MTFLQPRSYNLEGTELRIIAKKIGPPSKRITLHQKGLKIIGAKITRLDKRGTAEYETVRINHLPTFEQVRLHTKETMYPGPYQIELEYTLNPAKLKILQALDTKKPDRTLMPSIDEPEAWAEAIVEILS